MELKYRKAIANGVLSDDAMQKLKIQNMSTNPGGALNFTGGLEPKLTTSASGLGSLGSGGMGSIAEKDPAKFFGLDGASGAANSGGAGAFLKNNAGGIMSIASGTLDFVGMMNDISTNKISSDEMMGSGGTSNESANGISYQQSKVDEAGYQNQIDATAKAGTMAAMGKGAALGGAIGSVIPGLGTVAGGAIGGVIGGIAGLFGSSKAKREAERQKRIAINRTIASNTQNRETAYTTGLRNEFNRENRTDISLSLFHAALGVEDIEKDVDPRKMRTKHKYLADTAEHGVAPRHVNGFGSFGETMISGKADEDGMHKVHRIKRGPNDTAPIDLKKHDTVGSRLFIDYETGLPIADAIYLNALAHGGKISTEDKQRYEMNLNVERMLKYTGRRKENLFPGYLGGTLKKFANGEEYYDAGELPEITVTPSASQSGKSSFFAKLGKGFKGALGAVNSIGGNIDLGNLALLGNAYLTAAQRDARAEGIRAPKSFVANPYEQDALQQLNNLHSDYYPIWAQNREKEAAGKSAIMQSGGLKAGQKMLGFMGLTNQTQQNDMAALFEHQGRENALRAQAAKASLEAGNQSATRQQQAYQWDEDMFAKGHAAQDNKLETSAYDRQNGLTQFFKNLWEKNQFDRTMNLYESQLENDRAKTQAIINSLGAKQNPEVKKATIAPQTIATMQKLWNRNTNTVDLGELELPEFAVTPAKKVAKPKVTKRRTVKRGGKK